MGHHAGTIFAVIIWHPKLIHMGSLQTTAAPKAKKDLLSSAREIGHEISKYVDEDESNRRISPPVVNALKNAGFFKLFLPEALGGMEADPVTAAKVIEEVATHNTAAGWSLMVANTIPIMSVRLSDEGIDAIYGNSAS